MITKAGVPSNKVVVGVASYGRSFQMTEAGCTGPMCTYRGPDSGATPGECTNTAGYIANAEIMQIVQAGGNIQTFTDTDSFSDILVYDDVQWVAYTSDANKDLRTAVYESYNFGGISDWAVDLAAFVYKHPTSDLSICDGDYATIDDIIADTSIPDSCVNQYIMSVLSSTLDSALSSYSDIMRDGYDDKYNACAEQV